MVNTYLGMRTYLSHLPQEVFTLHLKQPSSEIGGVYTGLMFIQTKNGMCM